MSDAWPPSFLFAVCQCGAELALKNEIAGGPIAARPAFSRPGFVTFKLEEAVADPEQFQLPSTFARTFGFSLGKVQGDSTRDLTTATWELPGVAGLLANHSLVDVHVWQRDPSLPGDRCYEPGPTELSFALEQAIRKESPLEVLRELPAAPRPPSRRNRWILDVVLVEPGEWWIGCHYTKRRMDCWPGGVPRLELPAHAVSRAYLKMQEALLWSALPVSRGNLSVELGCAPGGASQALIDYGLRVLGVDPGEVAPEVLADPHFTHLRRRSTEVAQKHLQGAQWLAADMNVAPNYTLDAAEGIVSSSQANIRGMILTLKLTDWKLANDLPQLVERVRSWGYRDVRTRQLAFNRQELCLVALRSRGQRRIQRGARRRQRADSAHASIGRVPHFPTDS